MLTNKRHKQLKNQDGFTLVELLVSIGLISLVALYFIQYQVEAMSQRIAESLAQDILSIANTSLAFYGQALEWPDEDNDCVDLLQTLEGAGAFPANHTPAMDVTLTFGCVDNNTVGRVLSISATYPAGEVDEANLLLSYLPTSDITVDEDTDIASVVHYIAQPRKASQRYQFHRVPLSGGSFRIPKPDCWGDQNQEYMLIPQAVCINNAEHGIGGYYFDRTSNNNDPNWSFRFRVADGDNNNSDGGGNNGDYSNVPDTCGGEDVWIGAITYCDPDD